MKLFFILSFIVSCIYANNEIFPIINSGTHISNINRVVVTNDKKYIITASNDKSVRVWDIKKRKLIKEIAGEIGFGNEGQIFALALSSNNKYLAIGGYFSEHSEAKSTNRKEYIRVFDFSSGKLFKSILAHTESIYDLEFSKDDKYLISSSHDDNIKVYSVEDNFSKINTFNHDYEINSIGIFKYKNDYRVVATSKKNNNVLLYSLNNNKLIKQFKNTSNSKYIKVNNKYIVLSSKDKNLTFFDLNLTFKYRVKLDTIPLDLSFSPNGKYLLIGSANKKVFLYDIKKDEFIPLKITHDNLVQAVSFINNNSFVTTGGKANDIVIWKIDDNNQSFVNYGNLIQKVSLKNNSIFFRDSSNTIKKFDFENLILSKANRIEDKNIIYSQIFGLKLYTENENKDLVLKDLNNKTTMSVSRDEYNGYIHSAYGINELNDATIISGGRNGRLKAYHIKDNNLTEVTDLKGHEDTIISLDISDNRLVTSSFDQTMRIWDINDLSFGIKKEINPYLNIFISKNNEWIIWDNDGYFAISSHEAQKYLSWHINQGKDKEALRYTLDRLYDYFFRPDIIQLKLSGKKVKNENNFTIQDVLNQPPPKVEIEYNSTKNIAKSIDINSKEINLTFYVKNSGGGIGNIRIYHNEKLIEQIGDGKIGREQNDKKQRNEEKEMDDKTKKKQNKKQNKKGESNNSNIAEKREYYEINSSSVNNQEYNKTIELVAGENEISIEAFNKNNFVLSPRTTITFNANIPKIEPKIYAIIVGVEKFSNSNLNYSIDDAIGIEKLITTFKYKSSIITLFDENATSNKIYNQFDKIITLAKPKDIFIFFISTHGDIQKDNLFLLTRNKPVNFENLFKRSHKIKALNQIFIIDSCYSGKAIDKVAYVYDARSLILAKESGIHMLMASTKNTFVRETKKYKQSIFTYKLLKAFENSKSIKEVSKILKKDTNISDLQYPTIRNIGRDIILKK